MVPIFKGTIKLQLRTEGLERGASTTVETVNGDSQSTIERGPSLVGRLSCRAMPVQNKFFLTVHYFISFVPIAQQVGQAVVLGRLSLSLCLCLRISNGNDIETKAE
jgi:hypothetical protein